MVKKFLILLTVIFLFGCSSTPKPSEVRTVKVKVPVIQACPVPPEIERRPYLPIFDLTSKSDYNDIVKAYAISIKILQKKYEELYNILEGYRIKNEGKTH